MGWNDETMQEPFHNSIVYVDESGDHGPVSVEYPIFVLAFCLFDKDSYAESVTTAVQSLKFKYFGHDTVVLHEREIRKSSGPFSILQNSLVRRQFIADLNTVIAGAEFTIIAAAIRKDKYRGTANVYHLAMKFGLERIAIHCGLISEGPKLHFVCESRGRSEDRNLELEFRRICDGDNHRRVRMPCRVLFAGKERCHAGMELADLIARPIGRHILDPDQKNRAWEILEPKFRRDPSGDIQGWGLKVFP